MTPENFEMLLLCFPITSMSNISADHTRAEHRAALFIGESYGKRKELGLVVLGSGMAAGSVWLVKIKYKFLSTEG